MKKLTVCFSCISFVETEETYQIFVKDSKTSRDPSFLCDTYTHNEGRDTKTIIFKCKQPLVGTYIEIVPLIAKSIKVFEIEHFGVFYYIYINFPIIFYEIRQTKYFYIFIDSGLFIFHRVIKFLLKLVGESKSKIWRTLIIYYWF